MGREQSRTAVDLGTRGTDRTVGRSLGRLLAPHTLECLLDRLEIKKHQAAQTEPSQSCCLSRETRKRAAWPDGKL